MSACAHISVELMLLSTPVLSCGRQTDRVSVMEGVSVMEEGGGVMEFDMNHFAFLSISSPLEC